MTAQSLLDGSHFVKGKFCSNRNSKNLKKLLKDKIKLIGSGRTD